MFVSRDDTKHGQSRLAHLSAAACRRPWGNVHGQLLHINPVWQHASTWKIAVRDNPWMLCTEHLEMPVFCWGLGSLQKRQKKVWDFRNSKNPRSIWPHWAFLLSSGIADLMGHPRFEFIRHDVTEPFYCECVPASVYHKRSQHVASSFAALFPDARGFHHWKSSLLSQVLSFLSRKQKNAPATVNRCMWLRTWITVLSESMASDTLPLAAAKAWPIQTQQG